MKNLASLCRVDRFILQITGIGARASNTTSDVLPIALTAGLDERSFRAVLGIDRIFARQLVEMALGRSPIVSERPLSSGEQGILLYIADQAGGDWIDAGGGVFSVRGILVDGLQVPDYLSGGPDWEISCRIESEEIAGDAWLWLTGSVPPSVWTPSTGGFSERAALWPVELCISVGWARLRLEDVRTLASGDLILPDQICFPDLDNESSLAAICSGSWRREGRWIDRRTIEIASDGKEGFFMETKADRKKDVRAELRAPDAKDAGAMEVIVRVEVGRVTLTVDQAIGLVPGRVLRLERDVGPNVFLRIGEKLIAQGDLVEYEGGLAVEVVEVM